MTAYLLLKYVHVVLAITAVGSNLTYGVWLSRAHRDPRSLEFALKGIKTLDDRIANPAFGLLLLTGLGLLILGRIPWTTPWVLSAIVLFLVAIGLAFRVYSPLLGRQIKTLGSRGPQSPEFQQLSGRGRTLGILLGLLVLLIVFLMVIKPSLWG
jgi:uncharacterized membrane protein